MIDEAWVDGQDGGGGDDVSGCDTWSRKEDPNCTSSMPHGFRIFERDLPYIHNITSKTNSKSVPYNCCANKKPGSRVICLTV